MKRCLYLFFISIKLFAQEMPVSESNYFVYDKYHFGVDINNINIEIHEDATGQIVCSEYSGCIYKLNNTYLEKALPELKDKNPQLIKYFKLSTGEEYYCTSQEIIVTKNNRITRRIHLNSQNDSSYGYLNNGHNIYFVTYYFDGTLAVRFFDGEKIATLARLENKRSSYFQLFFTNHLIVVENTNTTVAFFKLSNNKLQKIKTYLLPDLGFGVGRFINENNFYGVSKVMLIECKDGFLKVQKNDQLSFNTVRYNPIFTIEKGQEKIFYDLCDFPLKNI